MTESEEKAKEWLNRNYGISLEIEAIKRRLERMNADLEKVTRPLKLKEVVEANNPGNSQEDRMADFIDLSDELSKRITYLMSLDRKTKNVIDKVDSPTLRTILFERYINRLSWKKIAEAIHHDGGWLFEMHRQALDAVIPFIPHDEK